MVDVDIGTSAFLARRYDVSRSMQGKTMMLRRPSLLVWFGFKGFEWTSYAEM